MDKEYLPEGLPLDFDHNNANYMRHDCDKDGCFNKFGRPKIEMFNGCFPRGCNFGDVDALAQLRPSKPAFCLLEWKSPWKKKDLDKGQRLTYESLTGTLKDTIVIYVKGDPFTMVVDSFSVFEDGKQGPWRTEGGLEAVRRRVAAWSYYVEPDAQWR